IGRAGRRGALTQILSESESRDRLAGDHVAELVLALAFAGGARDDHQRHQVLLARMTGAGGGGLVPGGEPRLAFVPRRLDRLVEPRVEGRRRPSPAVEEVAQIVVAHAAADDRDAL